MAAASDQVAMQVQIENGLFKTVNGGGSWQQKAFSGKTVRAIAIDPRNNAVLYASVLDSGVYVDREQRRKLDWHQQRPSCEFRAIAACDLRQREQASPCRYRRKWRLQA